MSFNLEDIRLTDQQKRSLDRSHWIHLEVTLEDWEWAEEHLAAVRATGYKLGDSFGVNAEGGYAAERVLARYMDDCDIPYTWYNDPWDRREDFKICGQVIDLKNQTTAGKPQMGYDVDITRATAMGSRRDLYLFTKINRHTRRDLWVLGFMGHEEYMSKAVYYNKGERTRTNMEAPNDCYCVRYNELTLWDVWMVENAI